MQEMQVRSLGQEDSMRRNWQPTPVFLPEKSHGQRSLVGYSPRGCKESDTTKHIHTHTTHTPHTEMTENSMPAKGLSICNLLHRPFDWGALDITMFISWACQIPCLKSTHLLVR